jgi:hypothetical protein
MSSKYDTKLHWGNGRWIVTMYRDDKLVAAMSIEDWTALDATRHVLKYKPAALRPRPVPKWLRRPRILGRADLKKLIPHAGERWMRPVLDLDPVAASTAPVGALTVLRDQALDPHPARRIEQIRADLAAFEWRGKDALGAPGEQLRQVGLAQVQRQPPQIFAAECQAVEGVQLHLVIVLPGDQGVEVGHAIDAQHNGLAIDHELLLTDLAGCLDDPGIAI